VGAISRPSFCPPLPINPATGLGTTGRQTIWGVENTTFSTENRKYLSNSAMQSKSYNRVWIQICTFPIDWWHIW